MKYFNFIIAISLAFTVVYMQQCQERKLFERTKVLNNAIITMEENRGLRNIFEICYTIFHEYHEFPLIESFACMSFLLWTIHPWIDRS